MSSEEPQKRNSTLRVKAIMPKPISFYHSHPVKPIYYYLISLLLIGETKGLTNFVSKIFAKINTQRHPDAGNYHLEDWRVTSSWSPWMTKGVRANRSKNDPRIHLQGREMIAGLGDVREESDNEYIRWTWGGC